MLQVVQRDMRLRKKEEERLSEMKQELDEEGNRCSLLSRQPHFNERCCIRCCSPFTFLLNPKRPCLDCRYNVCKACRAYVKRDKAWLCTTCQKTRLLKTQSLEWYYNNVKCRFKRFGSAKVLKTLYRKHLAEHGTLAELTEGSAYDESVGNEGSVCDSDLAFYRQSDEHSMAETLTVALRVAEEAIDEAISKAEFHTDNQEKQNEAHYLRENREELIEELAKTIVQKIIHRRRNLTEMNPVYDLDWPPDRSNDPLSPPSPASLGSQPCSTPASPCRQPGSTVTPHADLTASLWRSRSAFSLLDNSRAELTSGVPQGPSQGLKKEVGGSTMSNWKSVDRLDNSMLKSPDGNWIALQSTLLSRPSLLTQRKSLVYSVLERESGIVSAYDEMGSDTEAEAEGTWGAALLEIRRKMNTGTLLVDSEEGKNAKSQKSLHSFLKRKVPIEHRHAGTASPRRRSIIDVNFNPEEPESSGADDLEGDRVRRLRRKRRGRREQAERQRDETSFSSSVPQEYSTMLLETLVKKKKEKKESQSHCTSEAVTPDTLTSGVVTPEPLDPKVQLASGDVTNGSAAKAASMNQELNLKISHLVSRASVTHLSSTDRKSVV